MIKRDNAYKSVVKFSTTFIENGQLQQSLGTGFFLAKDNQHLFLVTANHVTKPFSNDTIVQMAGANKQIINVRNQISLDQVPPNYSSQNQNCPS